MLKSEKEIYIHGTNPPFPTKNQPVTPLQIVQFFTIKNEDF